jgi:hypothetical protein
MQLPYFFEIFIIAAWELWNLRSGVIFGGTDATTDAWTVRFRQHLLLQLHRFKDESQHRLMINRGLRSSAQVVKQTSGLWSDS